MRPTPIGDGHSVAAAVKALHGHEVRSKSGRCISGLARASDLTTLPRAAQVVAVPTDTLYGLAASANSVLGIQVRLPSMPAGIVAENSSHRGATPQKLYQMKGRDAKVPLAVCVADAQVWHALHCAW